MATVFYRYAEYKGRGITARGDLTAFTDQRNISSWARENVSWAVGYGLLLGNDDGTVNPQGNATRAETATILQRFLEK